MLALVYLGLAICLGGFLCRRFYRFVSVPHWCAGAILVGILVSTWFTYLAALVSSHTAEPLVWADLLFFVAAPAAIFGLSRKSPEVKMIEPRAPGRSGYDWTTLGVLSIAACLLLMATLYVDKQGRICVSGMEVTTFALQSAIAQSFALGHNFPPECPYYAGQPIHCDFLFCFQAGNLEFLGLNLAWSVALLSVLGLTSMLALVMTLGELLFNSRVVGRIGAVLFFFPGSMVFVPFLKSQSTPTLLVFVNQRHLPCAIGIFLLVLIFLADRYRQISPHAYSLPKAQNTKAGEEGQQNTGSPRDGAWTAGNVFVSADAFIFSGVLLGVMPLWSTPVLIATGTVLLLLLILFSYRLQVMLLGITAAVVALPQLVSSNLGLDQQALSHWAVVGSNPELAKLIKNIAFAFAAKWPLIVVALIVASSFQWRFFIALCSLFLLTFCTQLSTERFTNREFLNIWFIVANLFAACGLWQLWKLRAAPILGRVAATTLATFIVTGGLIEFFPIRNSSCIEVNYERDELVTWLRKNTKPNDVFLTDRFLTHPVLLAGRRIFLGLPDSRTGLDFAKRVTIYRQSFESKNPRRVFQLLKENHIDYVVFDDGVRNRQAIGEPNESLYVTYFPIVYEDKENRYRRLVMYKVPESLSANAPNVDVSEPPVTAFQGGRGSGKGRFNNPRSLAVDGAGNILVADTDNGRIEKFSPNGTYITSLGTKGARYEQLREPNGIAIDRAGNVYVAELSNHSVRKLAPYGKLIAEWKGPNSGFYGPQRITIGPDDSIYVVDQGNTRIVKFNPDGDVLAVWGTGGSGDGQFNDHTSVAIDANTSNVYVADPVNKRIQVFDSGGKFLTKWLVPEWGLPRGFEDLVIDSHKGRLYASSANMNTILVFDLQGNRLGTLVPIPPDKLERPSALALAKDKLLVLNTASARVSVITLQNR